MFVPLKTKTNLKVTIGFVAHLETLVCVAVLLTGVLCPVINLNKTAS